ncbi:MAG: ABC transporter permease [Terracidiphilus sp.]
MAGLIQDLRFSLRQLRKNLWFTLTATGMLAVAICANSTVFSWIEGTMLNPVPGSRDTSGLVSIMRGQWSVSPVPPLSYADLRDLREQNHSFTGILAYHHDWLTVTGGGQPERIYVANVTSNFFDLLEVRPALGRFFLPEEETQARTVPYVVISYSVWKNRFGADPSIVGKPMEIARHRVTVIGVAPEGFIGAMPGIREDIWVTMDPIGGNGYNLTHRDSDWLNVIGRLRPGVSREAARQDLDTVMRRIVAAYPDQHLGTNTITLDPMWRSPFGANGYMAETLPILLAIAGVVLLLTCVNVATLTLVRFVSRRREIAIRQSLGAGRMRMMRQMVLEGVLVSVSAGAVALLLTSWTAKSFALLIPANSNPTVLNGTLDWSVVLGIVVLALVAGVACGAFPAWRSSKVPAAEVLKEESASISGGAHNRHLLSGLVVAQIALSLALLVSSALLMRTLRNVSQADPGFERDRILLTSVGLNIAGYPEGEAVTLRHKILDRVSALPGVTVASITDWVPMSFTRKSSDAYPEGYVPHPHEWLEIQRTDVTARYFETLGIPILAGRDFSRDDNENAPRVAIVDQTAANKYWPGQDAVGKRLHVWGQFYTVIGVVKNTKHQLVNELPAPMLYFSYFQVSEPELMVQVKSRGNPEDMAPAVERTIHEIDGRLPVYDVRSLRETTETAALFWIMESTFAGIFAVIALVLAATGIYGVVAYRTQMRTHEIGIRVALGASQGDVLRLVLRQGMGLTALGLAAGLALSLGMSRLVATQLYGVSANDPLTVVVMLALLAVISLVACFLPAHRAMHASPVTAMREQ